MLKMRLGGIGLDCDDPVALSTFWAALLGGEIVHTSDSVAVVKLGDVVLNAYHVADHTPPTWPSGPLPKQAHIDIDVDDLPAAAARALDLGALRAGWQPDPDSYLVFLDPAGHPFCLTTQFGAGLAGIMPSALDTRG